MSADNAQAVLTAIDAVLQEQDLSRRQLARRLGVERMWVQHRMNGTTPLKVDDLQRIAAALGVPVTQLLPAAEPTAPTGGGQR